MITAKKNRGTMESHYSTYKELIAKTVAEQYAQRCRLAYALWIKHGGNPEPCTKLAWLAFLTGNASVRNVDLKII